MKRKETEWVNPLIFPQKQSYHNKFSDKLLQRSQRSMQECRKNQQNFGWPAVPIRPNLTESKPQQVYFLG